MPAHTELCDRDAGFASVPATRHQNGDRIESCGHFGAANIKNSTLTLSLSRVVLSFAVLACSVVCADETPQGQPIPLLGRLLNDVLADYRSAGFEFVYSAELVREGTRLRQEPGENDSIGRLRGSLEHEGLTLRPGHAEGVYRIVRHGVPRPLSVRGRVTDATTGQPLAGARIETGSTATTAGDDGRFRLPEVARGPLSVSMSGYETLIVPNGKNTASIAHLALEPLSEADEVVLVVDRGGTARADGEHADYQLVRDLGRVAPELDNDPLRITNRLIAMRSNGLSAIPHVRGGLREETVVLFNGMRLLEPFHLRDFQSVFSGLAPHAIKEIHVYAGGFPARYGDSLSGVLDIESVDPTIGNRAEFAWSFLNASAAGQGTLGGNRGAWAGSVRRGNLDALTRNVNPNAGTPSHDDGYGLVRWKPGAESRLELGVIYYNDDIEFRKGYETAHSTYRNQYWWARLERNWTSRWTTSTSLWTGSIRHERDGALGSDSRESAKVYGMLDDRRRFDLWSFSQRTTYSSATLSAEFGIGFERQDGYYRYEAEGRRGAIGVLLGMPEPIALNIRLDPQLRRTDGYVSVRYRPWIPVALQAGLRWDRQDYGEHGDAAQQVNPRFSVLLDLGPGTVLRIATGSFSQSEGVHQLSVGDGITSFQTPQRSRHVLAGVRHTFGGTGFDLHVEAFDKRYSSPKRRFENLFNPMVLLPELASDRVEVRPSRSRTDGFEVTLRYRRDERLNGWLAYTHSSARDWMNGGWTPRPWEQSDSVSAGVGWTGGAWSASTALLWHSGWRTTPLRPLLQEDADPLAHLNSERFPAFASVDVRLARSWKWNRHSLTAFLHVVNAMNRENLGGIQYTLERSASGDEFTMHAKPKPMIPLAPLLGVRWEFD